MKYNNMINNQIKDEILVFRVCFMNSRLIRIRKDKYQQLEGLVVFLKIVWLLCWNVMEVWPHSGKCLRISMFLHINNGQKNSSNSIRPSGRLKKIFRRSSFEMIKVHINQLRTAVFSYLRLVLVQEVRPWSLSCLQVFEIHVGGDGLPSGFSFDKHDYFYTQLADIW